MNLKGVRTAMKKNLTKKIEPLVMPRRPSVLRFSPMAWAKLLLLRDMGDTEIGGFGISAADDLMFVQDVEVVAQSCTWAHVAFDDDAVADFFDRQVDAGRRPEEFGRIWVHTHPGNSAEPSGTDEATFARVFSRSDWAVMFILARGGQAHARLRYNVGPGADIKLPVDVDYSRPFAGSNAEAWQADYQAHVRVPPPDSTKKLTASDEPASASEVEEFNYAWWRDAWGEYADFDRLPEEAEYGFIRDF
jgi:hypothetical protein